MREVYVIKESVNETESASVNDGSSRGFVMSYVF